MRIVRLLLLIAYVTSQSGWILPLPDGGFMAGACACGDSCCCAQELVRAGNCCCAGQSASRTTSAPKACCAKKPASCCASTAGDDDRDKPLAVSSCNCQQESPSGMTVCSDPRLIARSATLPDRGPTDVLVLDAGAVAPHVGQSPDDPVPRLTV